MGSVEERFSKLLIQYRDACPETDGGRNFLPGIWTRIQEQRLLLRRARGWTSALVSLAAVLCLVLAVLLSLENAPVTEHTYVDVLDQQSDGSVLVEASYQGENQ
jgi:anti-sigma-K factor RskA